MEVKTMPLVLAAMLMTGCSQTDEATTAVGDEAIGVSLWLSVANVSQQTVTRQDDDVVQETGQFFRGLKSLLVLPFTTNGQAVTADDLPQIPTTTSDAPEKIDGRSYYYLNDCEMMSGTDRVLVWGRSAAISGKESPAQNGLLETTLTGRMLLEDINFSLKSIRNQYDVHPDAQALADYMTAIANTTGWSTTEDVQLRTLYQNFIHADAQGTGLLAGSAAHVKAYVAALKSQLQAIGGDLSTAIIEQIDATGKSCLDNGYPSGNGSLGLPDGAAALRWTSNGFTVRTATTTLDNINGIVRYTYPAELWYFTDSPIRTSDSQVEKTTYAARTWSDLLDYSYQGGATVRGNTRSVAVEEPLQYGVGRLKLTLAKVTGVLNDANGETVSYLTASELPLRGVIIGGQHTVGFDFKPKGEQSDVDGRFIYDSVVGEAEANGDYTVSTLVLQSYDGEKVPIVLEFENKIGHQFAGQDGIVYPNTKFYLLAQVDPADHGDGEYANRVFTKDFTTTMTMKVNSLAKAYSCLPDLLAPRLEIGVEVTTQWIQSTPTVVPL